MIGKGVDCYFGEKCKLCPAVQEALQFSAHLRFTSDTPSDTIEQFISEVMALVELDSLANALVCHSRRSHESQSMGSEPLA